MSKIFDQLVEKRGFSEGFLRPNYDKLPSPFLLPDMKKAVERILEARNRGEKVIVYGDYDADGVTASTVMNEVLRLIGVTEVETMLPDRFLDGYGMSKKVVQKAEETGAKLVITVDCGSANGEIIEELNKIGVDTVVTDHHECPEELPKAVAVVNPKRRDVYKVVPGFEKYVEELMWLRDLAGVGVAFMVGRALEEEGEIPEGQEKWLLDLVLLGTICDSTNMSEVNRVLCFFGAKVMEKTRRIGLRELIRQSGVKDLTAEAVGFRLGPRINAAGRMKSPTIAFNLLNSKKKTEAASLAMELEKLNGMRRAQQIIALEEFKARGEPEDDVLVATGDWHEGILGIIAGRLVEDYKRPAFVLSEKDGVFKGSGRSFGDFNLAEALKACREEIVGGGGHAGAAGVKVLEEKIGEFREKINEYYRSLGLEGQERFFEVCPDLELEELEGLNLDLLGELKQLEPFGPGNEEPIFGLREMFVLDKQMMGADEQHLRVMARDDKGKTMKLVAFNVPEDWKKVKQGERADFSINLVENVWNGLKSVEGRILDLRGC